MLVKASPERVRLTYLSEDLMACAMSFNIWSSAFMATFIGLPGLLADCLSRYAFNASGLLKVWPEQAAAEKTNTATAVKSESVFLRLENGERRTENGERLFLMVAGSCRLCLVVFSFLLDAPFFGFC